MRVIATSPLGTTRVLVSIGLAGLLVAMPGAADSALGGTPCSSSAFIALGFVFCLGAAALFFPVRGTPRWLVPAMTFVVVLKIVVGITAVPHGWHAEYRFGDRQGVVHEARFFWRLASRGYRIDPAVRLDYWHSDLHFFNDLQLFGRPPYLPPGRDRSFPLQVTWTGYVDSARARNLVLVVSGEGTVAIRTPADQVTLDSPAAVRHPVPLSPGRHAIVVRYAKPAGVAPSIDALLLDAASGASVPTTPDPPSGRTWGGARVTSSIVLGGLALLALAMGATYVGHGTGAPAATWIVRGAGLCATITLAGWAVSLAATNLGRTTTFGGGGDPLVYASQARYILHDGPLLLQGAELGRALPFYFYPFYPYLLAVGHALVGENLASIFFVNGILLALLPLLLFALGWKNLPPVAGVAGFAACCAFMVVYVGPFATFSDPSLTDLAYLTLVFVALVLLARAYEAPSPARLVVAGVAMALGAATRPSLMTLFYLAPAGLWFAMRRPPLARWIAGSAWLAVGVFAGLLPFTIRNLVASGQFVVLVNSWIQIPYFLVPPEILEKPGGHPGLVQAILMAKDILLEHPSRTVVTEIRKVLYTLGLTWAGPSAMTQANGLVALTLAFALALWTRRLHGTIAIALVTFALSHLAAMVVAAPWSFHYKSILPLHLAFLFGAAYLLRGREPAAADEAPPPPPLWATWNDGRL